MSIAFVVVGMILLTGCSSHGPTRVRCNRNLEPINPPQMRSPVKSSSELPTLPARADGDPSTLLENVDGR